MWGMRSRAQAPIKLVAGGEVRGRVVARTLCSIPDAVVAVDRDGIEIPAEQFGQSDLMLYRIPQLLARGVDGPPDGERKRDNQHASDDRRNRDRHRGFGRRFLDEADRAVGQFGTCSRSDVEREVQGLRSDVAEIKKLIEAQSAEIRQLRQKPSLPSVSPMRREGRTMT